jgi:hypothetical protein
MVILAESIDFDCLDIINYGREWMKVFQRKLFYAFLLILGIFAITGCDPMYQVGIRHLSYIIEPDTNNLFILAQSDCYGVCFPGFGFSKDGGLTWEELSNLKVGNPEYRKLIDSSNDCLDSCEFVDKINGNIRYKVFEGKTLYRSTDNGMTWVKEVDIPKWEQYQINFIEKKYGSTRNFESSPTKGVNLFTLRGPFDAITDPVTKNLILAMGIEGVVVKNQGGIITWSEANRFSHIQTPTRWGMLGEINLHIWFSGIIIGLLLVIIGLLILKKEKQVSIGLITVIPSLLLVIIPFDILAIPIENSLNSCTINFRYYCEHQSYSIYTFIYGLFIILLFLTILAKMRSLQQNGILPTPKIILSAILIVIIYWTPVILWSQGLPLNYDLSTIAGFFLCFCFSIFYFSRINRKTLKPTHE